MVRLEGMSNPREVMMNIEEAGKVAEAVTRALWSANSTLACLRGCFPDYDWNYDTEAYEFVVGYPPGGHDPARKNE